MTCQYLDGPRRNSERRKAQRTGRAVFTSPRQPRYGAHSPHPEAALRFKVTLMGGCLQGENAGHQGGCFVLASYQA